MPRNIYHVVPNSKGGWSVKKGGADRASKSFDNQSEAVSYARDIVRHQHLELVIHRKDGTIQPTVSYGNDPMPSRDRDTQKKK